MGYLFVISFHDHFPTVTKEGNTQQHIHMILFLVNNFDPDPEFVTRTTCNLSRIYIALFYSLFHIFFIINHTPLFHTLQSNVKLFPKISIQRYFYIHIFITPILLFFSFLLMKPPWNGIPLHGLYCGEILTVQF